MTTTSVNTTAIEDVASRVRRMSATYINIAETIESFVTQTKSLQHQIEELTTKNENLEDQVTSLTTDNAKLKDQCTELTSNVSDMYTKYRLEVSRSTNYKNQLKNVRSVIESIVKLTNSKPLINLSDDE